MIYFVISVQWNNDVLANQVENIRKFNPNSKVWIYNAGTMKLGADLPVCPVSRPLKPGKLALAFLDTIAWLEQTNAQYDFLVFLNSEVMFIKPGFERYMKRLMHGYDFMGMNSHIQCSPQDTPHWITGQHMWREWDRWQPVLKCDFFYGALFANQVYRKQIISKIWSSLDKAKLEQLIELSEVYSLEEILPPTLVASNKGKPRAYPPESCEYARFGVPVSVPELAAASQKNDVYFVYPVPSNSYDMSRKWITGRKVEAAAEEEAMAESEFAESETSVISSVPKAGHYPSTLTIAWACYQGGMETALFNRIKHLNDMGAPSHAYFYYRGSGLPLYQSVPYRVSNLPSDLGDYIREHQFDVITFVNMTNFIGQLKHIGFKGKVLFEFHGYHEGIINELRRINEGAEGGIINGIVVPGNYVAAIARRTITRRDIPIYTALNSMDTNQFGSTNYDQLLKHYKVPESWLKYPFIGWVGRFDPNKNWPTMLGVMHRLKELHPNLKLAIASDITVSPELQNFHVLANQYNLTNDILLMPNVPYNLMPAFYSFVAKSGGVLLSTSYSEGYPYNLLEAQACECPVVCADNQGNQSVVQHWITGMVFPTNDISTCASQIHELLINKALHRKIVGYARKKICLQNDVKLNVPEYLKWISELRGGL